MVSVFYLKLYVMAIVIAGIFCKRDPWHYISTNSFNNDGLVGPPRIEKQLYALNEEYKTGETVILNSTDFIIDTRSCIQFDYYVNVPENDGLKFVLTDHETGNVRVLWSRYGFIGDVWRTATIDVNVKKGQFFQFQANAISGTVAFSQFTYDNTYAQCSYSGLQTDFEEESRLHWYTEGIPANTFGSNVRDHSSNSGKGRVAHMRTGSVIKPGTTLRHELKCMTFWYYHLSGPNTNPSNIRVLANGNQIWRSGDESAVQQEWIRAQVPLTNITDGGLISIETEPINGETEKGILIDDISFSSQKCPEPVSCGFVADTCGWSNKHDSAQNWILGRGRVEDVFAYKGATIPIRLNTIYTDFTQYSDKNGVTILSDLIPKGVDHCAKIYIMYDRISQNDVFRVEHLSYPEGLSLASLETLWHIDTSNAIKNVNNKYNEEIHEFDVVGTNKTSRLVIHAKSSSSISRMAINEIQFRQGKCKDSVKPTTGTVATKLNQEVLRVADELLKNSRDTVNRLIDIIKIDDPIKEACIKVLHEIDESLKQIENNLKN